MKKIKWHILILCAVLFFQSASFTSAYAAETETDPTVQTQDPTVFGTASILNGCRTIEGMVPLSGSERRLQSAQGVFVFDVNTKTVVYSYNPDLKLSPGTLTKLVAALVVMDTCELDETVVCHSKNISRLPGGTQNAKLKDQEELTVEQLLHLLLMTGANDAAVALAEHVAGNMTSFVTLMNERVRRIGCTATEFGNVHGLDNATQYSTARDMTRIYVEVMKDETLKKILFTARYEIPPTNRTEDARSLICGNYHIDENIVAKYYDSRVTGGLASYTNDSGAAIVVSAENKQLSLVLVILGARRDFADNGWLPTYYGNFDEMIELLEFAFNGFKASRIMYEGQALYQLPVTGGECDVVVQPDLNYDSVLPADCKFDNLIKNVTYDQLIAPIKKGDRVGTITLSYRSSVVAEAELFAMSDVEKGKGVAVSGDQTGGEEGSGILSVIVTVCLVILSIAAAYLLINALRRAYGRAKRRRRRANRRRSW